MKRNNMNKIPFYIMLVLGVYWISLFYLAISNPESGIFQNTGLVLAAFAAFYISIGILVIYLLRSAILFLTTGKWWK